MEEGNWVKINRKIWDNFLWDFENPIYGMAWIDMLLLANYKDKKIMFNGDVKIVEKGSFVTSIVSLSQRWHMNRRTVKKFLEMLKNENMISYKSDNSCTTVYITNYKAFQQKKDDECTAECTASAQRNAQRVHSGMHSECTAECTQHKNIKNIKEVYNRAPKTKSTNRFNNFNQRKYTDKEMKDLELRLLKK